MSRSIIFAASPDMASRTQIILILTCTCLVDCRLRGKFNKQSMSPTEHKNIQEVNKITNAESQVIAKIKTNRDVVPDAKTIRDEDAIVFPKDEDTKVYLDVNEIFKVATKTMDTNKHYTRNATSKSYVSLLPKVVPAVEAKEAFTNQVILNDENVTHKTKDSIKNTQTNQTQEVADAKVGSDAVTEENSNMTVDNNVTTIISNDTSSSNETVPDFSSRFGATGNYVLFPANNVQTYQAVHVPNEPIQDTNVQQYGTYSGQGNTNTPFITNTAINANIPNVANPQYSKNTNILRNEPYVTPNAPVFNNGITQGTDNVPISVGNTYMINGQLYAAVTVPNNVNVPSSVYLINPQLPQGSEFQGNNNLPLYKLVSVGQGDQENVNNQYSLIN